MVKRSKRGGHGSVFFVRFICASVLRIETSDTYVFNMLRRFLNFFASPQEFATVLVGALLRQFSVLSEICYFEGRGDWKINGPGFDERIR